MRILLLIALGWLLGRLWRRFQTWKNHRKLVAQLKALGVYGGTVDTGKAAKKPPEPVEISAEPDGPVPFGYKTSWAAIRCEDPERVIAALRPRSRQAANWQTGMDAAYAGQGLFVSPCLDGFVLVIGRTLPFAREEQNQFSEVQLFCSHRVGSCYSWEKYVAGTCVRTYAYEDSYVEASGPLTPEELALGFDRFPQAEQAEGGENVPGEEDVLNIAAAWGVDPRFEKTTYPPSAGWLCTI